LKIWVKAYNTNDAESISDFYEKSEKIDLLVSEGFWLTGHDAVQKMYNNDMKVLRFYDSSAEEMKHRIIDNIALVSFIHKFKYLIKESKENYAIHIRTTATLRKTKNGWKIMSEHSSAINGIQRKSLISPSVN